jgi:hypothetical protein
MGVTGNVMEEYTRKVIKCDGISFRPPLFQAWTGLRDLLGRACGSVSAECGICESTLPTLQGEDTLLDSVLYRELVYVDVVRLTQTQAMGAVESGLECCWIPPRVR